MEITFSQKLKEVYPEIQLATLIVRNVQNKKFDERLDKEKRVLEDYLRRNFQEPENIKRVEQYNEFYRKFGATFPIQYQMKSILAGKQIPSVSCLTEVMFMNELKNCCLTAGHDLDLIDGDLILDLAKGGEIYLKINDEEQKIKEGDIILSDRQGIIASVLYGPDSRTKITPFSKNIIYMTYFIFSIGHSEVISIMSNLVDYLRLAEDSSVQIDEIKIYPC